MKSLTIEHTWDGQAVDTDEQVHIALARTDEGDWSLVIDAPYHGDPAPTDPVVHIRRAGHHPEIGLIAAQRQDMIDVTRR